MLTGPISHRLAAWLLAVTPVAVVPTLGAQEARATVAVMARVAPAYPGFPLLPIGGGRSARTAPQAQVRVRRDDVETSQLQPARATAAGGAARRVGAGAGAASARARVWVRDDHGARHALVAGRPIWLGRRPAGERRLPGLDWGADDGSTGRVALVYEIWLVGSAQ